MPHMKRTPRIWNGSRWPRIRTGWVSAGSMIALHLTATAAWAQSSARLAGDDKGLLQWAIAAGILILVGIAGFINPKRSHRI